MRKRDYSGLLIILGVALAVVLLDQASKRWIEQNLPIGQSIAPVDALSGFFTFTHYTNTGAAFGLFSDQRVIMVIIPLVAILAAVVYVRYLPMEQRLVQIALGLQLGGAVGNYLFDRLRQGHVTDFIYFHFWPAFNIADASIVVGTLLLAWALLRYKEPEAEAVPDTADPQTEHSSPVSSS